MNNGLERYCANFKDSDILRCAFVFTIILRQPDPAEAASTILPTVGTHSPRTEPSAEPVWDGASLCLYSSAAWWTWENTRRVMLDGELNPGTSLYKSRWLQLTCEFRCNAMLQYREMSLGWNGHTTILTWSYTRLPAGRSVDRIPVAVIFPAPVQTGPEAHSTFCTIGTGLHPWVKRTGRGLDHPPSSARRLKED